MSIEPTDAEIIRDAIESRLLTVHTSLIGKVSKYYADKQTADIELVVNQPLRLSDDSVLQETLPILPNVPIKWTRAGGFTFCFPLAVGDHVEVTFHEASFQDWRGTGQVGDVGDQRRFDLSHATATPCLSTDDDPVDTDDAPDTDANEVVLNGGGTVRIGAKEIAVFVALSTLVDQRIAAIQQAFDTHLHPTGVGPSGVPATPIGELATVAATKLKAQ